MPLGNICQLTDDYIDHAHLLLYKLTNIYLGAYLQRSARLEDYYFIFIQIYFISCKLTMH